MTQHQAVDRQPAGYLTEIVNLKQLCAYELEGSDRRPDALRAYIAKCQAEGVAVPELGDDFVQVSVPYYRKFGWLGRRYAQGPSLQHLTREARSAALGGHALDADMVAAHPRLLLRFLKEKHNRIDDFPLLAKLCGNPMAWRRFVAEYTGSSLQDAKAAINKLFYFGRPVADLPPLWGLSREIAEAVAFVLGHDDFGYLRDQLQSRRNPIASRFAYAMAAMEDDLPDVLMSSIDNHCVAWIFDGFAFIDLNQDVGHFEGVLNGVAARYEMEVRVSPFAPPRPADAHESLQQGPPAQGVMGDEPHREAAMVSPLTSSQPADARGSLQYSQHAQEVMGGETPDGASVDRPVADDSQADTVFDPRTNQLLRNVMPRNEASSSSTPVGQRVVTSMSPPAAPAMLDAVSQTQMASAFLPTQVVDHVDLTQMDDASE